MLDLAEMLNPLINARAARVLNDELRPDEDEDVAETTLTLVFFDGEEAFKDWTDTDSIYGARHLAQTWATTALPPHPRRRYLAPGAPTTPLALVEHLILLDLLGARNPQVRSYFPDTAWLFDALVAAGNSVLVVEHDMDFMRAFADSVTVLHAGRVLAEGGVTDVQADPRVQEVYLGTSGSRGEVA